MEYEIVIGLEIHIELATNTKLFCGCPNEFTTDVNKFCCPVCAGFPGANGSLNCGAIEKAVLAGLALNCEIQNDSRFDRKHYFYPDLSTAYQTTQFYRPICVKGSVPIIDGKQVRITQIHIEEDAGKLIHDPHIDQSYIDLNRSARCLIEIVSEPDMHSKEEVVSYINTLRDRVRYTGASECKMEEGTMRCDVNISVRKKGETKLGVRSEIKNMASVSSVEKAIVAETKRHIAAIEAGEQLVQDTRGWNEEKGQTFAMREKAYATDYRYFPDPSLPYIHITEQELASFADKVPELPDFKRERYPVDYGLNEEDTEILIGERKIAELFETTANTYKDYKKIANWLTVDLQNLLKEKDVSQVMINGQQLADLLNMVDSGTINTTTGKNIFADIVFSGEDPKLVVEQKGLAQISDDGEIREMIVKVISENPNVVADFKGGKDKALTFFVGQIMKATKGKSNPKIVNEILKEELSKV